MEELVVAAGARETFSFSTVFRFPNWRSPVAAARLSIFLRPFFPVLTLNLLSISISAPLKENRCIITRTSHLSSSP